MLLRYTPTHLRPQHRRRRWETFSVLAAAGVGLGVLIGAIWVFSLPAKWSGAELSRINASRSQACRQVVKVHAGESVFSAQGKKVCSWLKPLPEPERRFGARPLPEPEFDPVSVRAWLSEISRKVRRPPSDGVREVDSRGNLVKLLKDPVSGIAVTGLDTALSQIVDALQANVKRGRVGSVTREKVVSSVEDTPREVNTDLKLLVLAPSWDDTRVAAAPLVYQAAPTQKWVDVNLTNQTIAAYEGSALVLGPFPMISGHPAAPTVQGSFRIYHKVDQQVMRGVGWDGPYAEEAPWIMYFDGDYAIHGAPWRSTFVSDPKSGSHGCINLLSDNAKLLYDWAPMGTMVISH